MGALRLALTPGEPAGIGPDLAVRLAQTRQACELVAVGDPEMLAARARLLDLPLTLEPVDYARTPLPAPAGVLRVDAVACPAAPTPGRTDPANARYVLDTLDRAVDRCRDSQCAALVTGPVHKAVINAAGIDFSGHTGYLAERCGADEPVMMLATDDGALRVALVTVHIPLSAVPAAVTAERLGRVLRVTAQELTTRFGIARPRLLVAGLNPHAGEDGYLGREEIDTVAPVIAAERERGLDLVGPLPADTLFTPHRLADADAVVALYHDQGLPVIKHLGFGRTVNISLGLPIVRTSVDHGTALDLAGTDAVDTGSLRAAIATALHMARAGSHGP
ncbi:4-hydroxythreonine-4-phosphate dehydrogenase PdxA [Salinisphaera orenii]|uniref:4-hydroxythreonine-4-phosphate dehydrogenase n=1 Tax=Salinisphaera orenii YIM 95161 TaxID=1051139 RepID=A0A423PGP9_9GAMM|nr:4-hydroxythreonine-4-phosphate dehydrogenase PdxA [Salinisphaera halophila]ROO24792.1 4-hydroxythreonine-4-phosphate dehydrogenase [Salinisphaera halophila YIM 95161]